MVWGKTLSAYLNEVQWVVIRATAQKCLSLLWSCFCKQVTRAFMDTLVMNDTFSVILLTYLNLRFKRTLSFQQQMALRR